MLLASAVCIAPVSGAEVPPKPAARVPLSALGFPGYVLSLIHVGASMATVHMVDNTHVLFTYSMRSLVPRLPGDDVNDTDRQVAAVLVELPSGKVLGRAKWHLHDHGQYLWNVGHGVFALRMGSDLSLFAPMKALAAGADPFSRLSLPHGPGRPELLAGSPDGKMITVEVSTPAAPAAGDDEPHASRKHYTIEFFRLSSGAQGEGTLEVSGAGAVGSPALLRLPLDGDGYLWAEDGERGKWMVSFNEFGGKLQPIAPVLSSCHPRLSLLSRSQFLAETCRGSDLRPMLAAYGFDGHENWEEEFGEALQPPTLALAPEAGRFAVNRLVASSNGGGTSGSSIAGDDPISQEIRVYQTESGDLLLHLQCAPAVRSAENFDLSPDGRTLVVLGPETLDFYRLPELSAKDRKELEEAQTMMPPAGSGPVLLSRITKPVESPRDGGEQRMRMPLAAGVAGTATSHAGSSVPATSPGDAEAAPVSTQGASAEGQRAALRAESQPPEAKEARKPPTLLNPGEAAEFRGQNAEPK